MRHERWNGYPDAARRALEVLNLLDVKPMRALLLAVGTKMPQAEILGSLNFLISLAVRLMIAGNTRSGSVEEPLSNVAKDVYGENVTSAPDLRKALEAITPGDEDFQREFATARVSNAKLARYYLRSLEMAAKGESDPWFVPLPDKEIINLEHVLPKKSEENWPEFTEDEVSRYVRRLGNQALMLATDNSDLKSIGFDEKKKVYADSPYTLTSEIAEVDTWNPEAVETRQTRLAELSVTAWPLK